MLRSLPAGPRLGDTTGLSTAPSFSLSDEILYFRVAPRVGLDLETLRPILQRRIQETVSSSDGGSEEAAGGGTRTSLILVSLLPEAGSGGTATTVIRGQQQKAPPRPAVQGGSPSPGRAARAWMEAPAPVGPQGKGSGSWGSASRSHIKLTQRRGELARAS